jgi:hypothetical protein
MKRVLLITTLAFSVNASADFFNDIGDWVSDNKTVTAIVGVGALTAAAVAVNQPFLLLLLLLITHRFLLPLPQMLILPLVNSLVVKPLSAFFTKEAGAVALEAGAAAEAEVTGFARLAQSGFTEIDSSGMTIAVTVLLSETQSPTSLKKSALAFTLNASVVISNTLFILLSHLWKALYLPIFQQTLIYYNL